jgi:DNA-binding transcriptional LysR family regulator
VEIETGTAVVAAVADKVADLGLVDSPASHPAVRPEVLREAQAHCILPTGHSLAGRALIDASDLDGEPMIALARRFSSRTEADRAFDAAGARPRIVAEAATIAFLIELVRRGVGFAVCNPFPISLTRNEGVVIRPFTPRIAYRTMLLFPALGAAPPAARAFADALKANQLEDGLTTPIR